MALDRRKLLDLEHKTIQILARYLYSYATLDPAFVIVDSLSTQAAAQTAQLNQYWEHNANLNARCLPFPSFIQWILLNVSLPGINALYRMSHKSGVKSRALNTLGLS